MSKNLLVVESPAKSKTIEKYLGPDFKVLASFGHLRDLPAKNGSVDIAYDFAMKYELIERNIGHVNDIIREARKADVIYLATDLDREGEAISWHIREILQEKGVLEGKKVHRITFSEITPSAVKAAVAAPRELLMPLVDAQQARRALDYLVGFNLSPVLWRKVQKGLSAGRVQSPALRMIVQRQEEIEKFQAKEYWSIAALLNHPQTPFSAKLTRFHDQRVEQFTFVNESQANAARNELEGTAQGHLIVHDIASRERKRKPAPPFTTSTLQQEASRKLGFATSRTMKVAQSLYEGVSIAGESIGVITYMRTDAVNLSEDAIHDIRAYIGQEYSHGDYLPAQPVRYHGKSKNAQEAHEAIRPSSVKRTPQAIAKYLNDDQRKLYELIWKRTVACQMAEAILSTTSVDFKLTHAPKGEAAFRASGTTVVFPGFLAVYEEGHDTKTDDDDSRKLPLLKIGDRLPLKGIATDQHFTEPPPKFNEATLVKTMEEFGIGRPSTYAAIIQVLTNREYVTLDQRRFMPTDVGRAVAHFLIEHFPAYVDYEFTSKLEDDLDAVSRGENQALPLLRAFWGPFKAKLDEAGQVSRDDAQGARMLGEDPKTGKPVGVRLGKYGPVAFKGHRENKEEKLEFASLLPGQQIGTITLGEALGLFQFPKTLGQHEGKDVIVNRGPYGPFAAWDGVKASLDKEDDITSIDFERALSLVKARKELQANRIVADLGEGIQILNGKYGVYVTNGKINATVPKSKDPKAMGLVEARRLLEEHEALKGSGHGGGKRFGGKKGSFKGKNNKAGKKDKSHNSVDDLPM